MIFNSFGTKLDTIHITITRPKNAISYEGEETPIPTDKLYIGVLKILTDKAFQVDLVNRKFVNTGIEYIEQDREQIAIQIRSTHLMKYGNLKIKEILNFLKENNVHPRSQRSRKKGIKKQDPPSEFYQITRLDFAHDIETNFDLVRVLGDGIGYRRTITGIQKDYDCLFRHENKRLAGGKRKHLMKEIIFGNSGFSCSIYNKKLEIIEKAKPEKFLLYPQEYRDVVADQNRYLFRVELRFFRSRSIKFNSLTAEELFNLATQELKAFGNATNLIRQKKRASVKSKLFSKLFQFKDECGGKK